MSKKILIQVIGALLAFIILCTISVLFYYWKKRGEVYTLDRLVWAIALANVSLINIIAAIASIIVAFTFPIISIVIFILSLIFMYIITKKIE